MQATSAPKRGIETFFVTLVVLAVLRVVLAFATVPIAVLPIANIAMGCLFLGGPLFALCFAARDNWTRKMATQFFVGGVILQVGCFLLKSYVFQHVDIPAQVINALGQIGLPIWCVGLGALLATLIKDQNIVVPIAIFLAWLDMFLVFSPLGVTHMIIKRVPDVLPQIAIQIPVASHQTTGERISPGALAGPADFLFLAMFLIAIFKFNMRGKHTVLYIVPTLLAYMLLVNVIKMPLPALVPIGIVVLLVNWKEFKLTKDEILSTWVVSILGIALFTWGMFQKATVVRAGISPKAGVVGAPKPPNSLVPEESDQP